MYLNFIDSSKLSLLYRLIATYDVFEFDSLTVADEQQKRLIATYDVFEFSN